MPLECVILERSPVPISKCPRCGAAPFRPFLRGTVQRLWRPWWKFWGSIRPYCAVICSDCKDIVGYENPWPEGEELRYVDAD
jgi:hypothetical protein